MELLQRETLKPRSRRPAQRVPDKKSLAAWLSLAFAGFFPGFFLLASTRAAAVLGLV